MYKKAGIRQQILIPVSIILLVGILLMSVVIWQRASSQADRLTRQILEETVNRYANHLKEEEEKAFVLATSAAPLVNQIRGDAGDRERVVEAFREVVEANPNILGIWTVWEADSFDSGDSAYRGRDYHDSTGRFIPYVYRSGGAVLVEARRDYDNPEKGGLSTRDRVEGAAFQTAPYLLDTGSGSRMVHSYVARIEEDGRTVGVVGVDIDLEEANLRLQEIAVMDSGYLFSISAGGYLTSHPSDSRRYKYFSDAKAMSYEDVIADVLKNGGSAEAMDRSESLGTMTRLFFQAVPVGNLQGWQVVAGVVPTATLTASSRNLALLCGIAGLILVLVTGVAIFLIVRHNLRDLPLLTQSARLLAQGRVDEVDCGEPGPADTHNEVALLRSAFSDMVHTIQEQVRVIDRIAQRDLAVEVKPQSDGDLLNLSLREMLQSVNEVFHTIRLSADIVTDSSRQIAQGAQQLAMNSTEQSSAVSELSHSVEEVALRADENRSLVEQTVELTNQMISVVNEGTLQMDDLTAAVGEINESSAGISSVIKMIDDIAFQTNILSLNAAVEAARAGQHGRGFAVVADEVRALAAKSAAAARETDGMISGSRAKAAEGAEIAGVTSRIFHKIVGYLQARDELIHRIPAVTAQQTAAIEQIVTGIGQTAQAAAQNSSTAEQSAAASEELNNQAEILRQQIARFRLSKDPAQSSWRNPGAPCSDGSPEESGYALTGSAPF